MNNNVRKITDGAMMVAIIGVYLVINRGTGYMFDGLLLFMLPLPLVFYGTKYGFKDGLLPYAAMIFLAFILGGLTQMFYIASEGMCGLIYGAGIKKNASSTTLLLRTIGIGIFVNLISTVVLASVFGYDLASEQEMFDEMLSTVDTSALNYDFNRLYKIIIIISAALTGVMEGTLTHLVSKFMLKRLKFKVEAPKSILSYNIPKWTAYVAFIGCTAANVLFARTSNMQLKDVLLIVYLITYLFLAFCAYMGVLDLGNKYFNGKRWIGVIIYIIAFMTMPILILSFGFMYIAAFRGRLNNA